MEQSKLMTVPIKPAFYEEVRNLASYRGLSISGLVRAVLRDEIDKRKETKSDDLRRRSS